MYYQNKKRRETINTVVKEPYISNTNIDVIKQNIKPSKAFYQSLSKRFCNEPVLIKNKWQTLIRRQQHIDGMTYFYCLIEFLTIVNYNRFNLNCYIGLYSPIRNC